MATAPKAAEPVVAAEIIIIDPAEIAIGDRLREIDPVHAEALGLSMLKDGQISPIEVCRLPGQAGWHLAGPGGHRLTGARLVGMDGIEARVVSANRDSRELREAVENLFSRGLDPIDRAAHIAALVRLKRAKAGLAVTAMRDAKVKSGLRAEVQQETGTIMETISMIYGWSDELGAELGFSGRTIRNDLLLYRGLRPSLVTRLRECRHPMRNNAGQLRALAKLDHAHQAKVVELLTVPEASRSYGVPRTIGEAISHPLGPKPAKPIDAGGKRLSAFIGAFQRMSLAERKGALEHLAPSLPDGFAFGGEARFAPDHEQRREEVLAAIDTIRDVVEGLIEDELLPFERQDELRAASTGLQLARFNVVVDAFDMGDAA